MFTSANSEATRLEEVFTKNEATRENHLQDLKRWCMPLNEEEAMKDNDDEVLPDEKKQKLLKKDLPHHKFIITGLQSITKDSKREKEEEKERREEMTLKGFEEFEIEEFEDDKKRCTFITTERKRQILIEDLEEYQTLVKSFDVDKIITEYNKLSETILKFGNLENCQN